MRCRPPNRRHYAPSFAATFLMAMVASTASGAQLVDGVLMVDGRPFYPLGSWNSLYTTPEDIARLGMNTAFRGGPGTEAAVEEFRGWMRRADERGIQVVPYLSYGGAGVEPWPPGSVRVIARLGTEPNLLAWYVGDDITMKHLAGIEQTVSILREVSPGLPTVADYIAEETPEARTTFTQSIDIRCQYSYPIPFDSISAYLRFFERQRQFVGDPLWTWVQSFQWQRTGLELDLGIADGPGPIPDPEQVRLLAFAAINRGVRGLFFFPHHELHLQQELAAEVALVCQEVRLVSDFLAAGTPIFGVPSSNPQLDVTGFRLGGSCLLSAMLVKPTYHRWIDEGIVREVTVEAPWDGPAMPRALLVAMPDVVECAVRPGTRPNTIRVEIPSIELAGFVLVSADGERLDALRSGMSGAVAYLPRVALAGSVAQTRKVGDSAWRTGFGYLYEPESLLLPALRANERAADAFAEGRSADGIREWRNALRTCRAMLDSMMRFAESRQEGVPPEDRRYLLSPHSLHRVSGLRYAPGPGDPWNFARQYLVAGPFPLEFDEADPEAMPPGMAHAYPPERGFDPSARFGTVDGPAGWQRVRADMSGLLNFRKHFATTDNVVCYARTLAVAPREMDIDLSLGSNDGAKVWVNGEPVFAWHGGRTAEQHQNAIPIHLTAGDNVVLVKVENLGANWQLYLSFRDQGKELRFEGR